MAVEAPDRLLVLCANCSTANRVVAERLGDDPKCGRCGAPLLDGKPVALERAAGELKTRVRFAKVNTEGAQRVAARFGIRSIPTLILFRGGREVARVSGAMDARSIASWVVRHSGVT